jgi:hypothetical protein
VPGSFILPPVISTRLGDVKEDDDRRADGYVIEGRRFVISLEEGDVVAALIARGGAGQFVFSTSFFINARSCSGASLSGQVASYPRFRDAYGPRA